LGLAIFGCGR